MARLAIAKSFLAEFGKLPKQVQKRVVELTDKFREHTHAGVHLEKPEGARDPRMRTVRVDRKYRGVVLDLGGDEYLLMHVLVHDDAYDKTHKTSVNAAFGVLEVRDEAGLQAFEPVLQQHAEQAETRLFGAVSDAELERLGIDPELLPLIRLFTDDQQIYALESRMPRPQFDVLVGLASGMTPDDVLADVAADFATAGPTEAIDTDDFAAAARRSLDWVAFVDDDRELAGMLKSPFSAWRVYLHATQRSIAYHDSYSGPFLLTGAAGTGKTVTALHRARHLAQQAVEGERPILVTTFTKALAATLQAQLNHLIDDQGVRNRIEILHVDALAYRIVRDALGEAPSVLTDRECRRRWKAAATHTASTQSPTFLHREWEQVILAQRIHTGQDYLIAIRRGRGTPLSRSKRGGIWYTVEAFTAGLRADGLWTHHELADRAADRLLTDGVTPYGHIVVDEAQDLHPAQWRLLRAAVAPGADDLFITGDPHQRIYNAAVTLSALGIPTRGRSRRLRVSYRTTQEILATAVPTLGTGAVDPLGDDTETLTGYRSLLHGRKPAFAAYDSRADEFAGLVAQVRAWLEAEIEPDAIGVAARDRDLVRKAAQALELAGIDTGDLGDSGTGMVRVGTMHGMKGLEFSCVAVIGAESGMVPATWPVTPIEEDAVAHEHDLQRERCLLFVACTRPRDSLTVSYVGAPSPFLPAHTPAR